MDKQKNKVNCMIILFVTWDKTSRGARYLALKTKMPSVVYESSGQECEF